MISISSNATAVCNKLKWQLATLFPGAATNERIFGTAAESIKNAMVQRIHGQGKASDGSDIGVYATRGKQLKAKTGGKVNLVGTGRLRDGLSVQRTPQGFGIGWGSDELVRRSHELERKYGKRIWHPSAEELQMVFITAQNEAERAIS